MDETRKKGSHLTWQDRHEIQRGLREHRSFAEIAIVIGCSPDTISKEIRKHRYHKVRPLNSMVYIKPNCCRYREKCRRRDICKKKRGYKCRIPCRECFKCNELCPDFINEPCQRSVKAPYVCNACPKSKACLFDKYLYNADYAYREYKEKLHESRRGINLTRDELANLDALVSPLVLKGQPLVHIMQEHEDEIPCGLRTLYRYVGAGYLSAKSLDMHRLVRYRKRKPRTPKQPKVSHRKKTGRHYRDYLKRIEAVPNSRVVQMDTVEGVKGGKLLQTFLWTENNLMLAFLIDSKEMQNTVGVFNELEELLGIELFREMFPLILTDNGTEFADPELFETGKDGDVRTSLYYCEPRHSEQKGNLEKNHEYIRYILPKGRSFDELTQEKVLLMINHINNTTRPKFHGSTPMKEALRKMNPYTLDLLGLRVIPSDEVCLKPNLLK